MLERYGSLICGCAVAATLSQTPEYLHQYQQRLGGAIEELRGVVEQFDRDAAKHGLDRKQGLQRYTSSADGFLGDRGLSIGKTVLRFERLTEHQAALKSKEAFAEPFLYMRYADKKVSAGTFDNFEPAMPLTLEGATYAGVGFLIGRSIFRLLFALFARLQRRFRPVQDTS